MKNYIITTAALTYLYLFILTRNENVKSLDESFWETAFTIHIPADSVLPDEVQQSQHTTRSIDNSKSSRGSNSVQLSQHAETIMDNRSHRGSNSVDKTKGKYYF